MKKLENGNVELTAEEYEIFTKITTHYISDTFRPIISFMSDYIDAFIKLMKEMWA